MLISEFENKQSICLKEFIQTRLISGFMVINAAFEHRLEHRLDFCSRLSSSPRDTGDFEGGAQAPFVNSR